MNEQPPPSIEELKELFGELSVQVVSTQFYILQLLVIIERLLLAVSKMPEAPKERLADIANRIETSYDELSGDFKNFYSFLKTPSRGKEER